jgi:hypothetical protein
MTKRKPQKRLVGWKQYVRTTWAKGVSYSGATAVTLCGVGFLVLGAILLRDGFGYANSADKASIVMGGIGCCIGAALTIWYATTLFKDAHQIESVELITRRNVKELPADETLLRGSDRPRTDSYDELLRATGQEPETPSEQLLRATQGNRLDV